MKNLLIIPVMVALSVRPAFAQDVDAMARWTALTVVHYRVVGEFSGEVTILSAQDGQERRANIADRIEFELDWNQQEFALVGTPVVRNVATRIVGLVPVEGCPAPRIEGTLEELTLAAVTTDEGMRSSGVVILGIKRDQPGGSIPYSDTEGAACGAAWSAAEPRSETTTMNVQLPPAMMLEMPGAFTLSADKKSMITTTASGPGWTWTFTPTPGK